MPPTYPVPVLAALALLCVASRIGAASAPSGTVAYIGLSADGLIVRAPAGLPLLLEASARQWR